MIVVTLTVTQGNDHGAAFRILDGEAKIIGRSSKADIVLNDAGVSRKHCRVRVTQGTPHLFDVVSTAPYLHDGRALTLEELWTVFNPDETHGITGDLTKAQLNELVIYLKGL